MKKNSLLRNRLTCCPFAERVLPSISLTSISSSSSSSSLYSGDSMTDTGDLETVIGTTSWTSSFGSRIFTVLVLLSSSFSIVTISVSSSFPTFFSSFSSFNRSASSSVIVISGTSSSIFSSLTGEGNGDGQMFSSLLKASTSVSQF